MVSEGDNKVIHHVVENENGDDDAQHGVKPGDGDKHEQDAVAFIRSISHYFPLDDKSRPYFWIRQKTNSTQIPLAKL